jgi:NAD(P)-dependent dehydrogenase (short-subunit alcohol dehydrogenase family)
MLSDNVVIVTGGAGRIGSAISRKIIECGGSVVLVDINDKQINLLRTEFGSNLCLALNIDVSNEEGVNLVIEKAVSKFGRIDSVIHSAYPRSPQWGNKFEDIKQKYLYQDLSSQIGGSILFAQKVLEYFYKNKSGNLIFVSSIQGFMAPKFEHYKDTNITSPIEYTAAKHSLIGITRYLAKYYKGNNIRVNCVSPGGILDDQPESFLKEYKKVCNDKGMLDAEDVVGAFIFLLSDLSRYVTGQNIVVDDGWSL